MEILIDFGKMGCVTKLTFMIVMLKRLQFVITLKGNGNFEKVEFGYREGR